VTRALVLGGGGIAGISWEIGVLAGLAEAGVDVLHWDLVVGTSAGAYVGARTLLSADPEALYAGELESALADDELDLAALTGPTFVRSLRLGRRRRLRGVPSAWFLAVLVRTLLLHAVRHGIRHTLRVWQTTRRPDFDPDRVHTFGQAIGSIALLGRRGSDDALIAYLARVFGPGAEWPATRFETVAADTATGRRVPLDASAGVSIAAAVAASMALPGFVVPVRAGERRLMDGGVTSATSADLADGFDEILVIAPLVTPWVLAEIEGLRASGSRVDLISPTDTSVAMWSGLSMMDPICRPDAARAGRRDGIRAAPDLSSGSPDRATPQRATA
jgi:NTE family protein